MRSRVELASVLEGVLDLSNFEYKTGKFYEGEAPPMRVRNRVKVLASSYCLKPVKCVVFLTFLSGRKRSGSGRRQSPASWREERELKLRTPTIGSPPAWCPKMFTPIRQASPHLLQWELQTKSPALRIQLLKKKLNFLFPLHPDYVHSPQ